MHIIVKLILICVIFSSFHNIDLLCSMLDYCCMPRCQEWGTVPPKRQQRGWIIDLCLGARSGARSLPSGNKEDSIIMVEASVLSVLAASDPLLDF